MGARAGSSPSAPAVRRFSFVLASRVAFLLAAFLVCDGPSTHALTKHDTGQWTQTSSNWDPNSTNKYAIHLALLRGENPFHSRILWWSHDANGVFNGGEWGWKTGSDGCDSFPQASSFVPISVPSSGEDLFCSGFATLADARALSAGGTDSATGAYGDNQSRVWKDSTGSYSGYWINPGLMKQWRWYPTVTSLATGSALVLSGDTHPHHRYFAAKRDGAVPGSPLGDSLYRFAPVTNGRWDRSVVPLADASTGRRPALREGHSAVNMETWSNIKAHVYFGGLDTLLQTQSELWFLSRLPNITGDDYVYQWRWVQGLTGGPTERSHHSAIVVPDPNAGMFVWGGRTQLGTAIQDQTVYRLNGFGGPNWHPITPTGTAPSARFAHTAIYDGSVLSGQSTVTHRMIVFGGKASETAAPSDATVWVLTFSADFQSATWSHPDTVDLGSGAPAPRFGHTMVWDGTSGKIRHIANKDGNVGFMFGGQLGTNTYSDELWALWLFKDGRVGWERLAIGPAPDGKAPAARARHSMVLDASPQDSRLYLFGGENNAGQADTTVWVVDPWVGSPSWQRWAAAGFHLSGQSAVLDGGGTARIADVYNPSSGWQDSLSSTTLLQHTYPPTFLIPGGTTAAGRVLSLAQNDSAYWMDVANSESGNAWNKLANGGLGFSPESGVLYQPTKIMMAGGTVSDPFTGITVTGTTKTLDLSNLNHSWVTSGPMVPRVYTNLVLLPNGQVAAIGGTQDASTDVVDHPVRRPQIWDPAGNGGVGAWGDTILDRQPTTRNYHSTAILLPDGRILSASGEKPNNADKYLANIFCPPYLFTGDALATRPAIGNVVERIRYAAQFSVCLSASDSIAKVCLIRAGATTHAFDENQRYVPLTFAPDTLTSRLTVTAPPDSFVAPPGDYMLFLVNKLGVPSIARWLRVGSVWDENDHTKPDSVADLGADAISQHSIWWSWTVPGDDGALGQPWQHKIVHKNVPITSANFASSSPEPNVVPECVGNLQTYEKDGLAACTYYYAAIQVVDESNNYSSIGYAPRARTLCSGGGGGGGSAHQAREEGQGSAGVGRMATHSSAGVGATSASLGPGSVSQVLVASYERTGGGPAWTLYRLDPAALGAGVDPSHILFQEPDGAGGWSTRRDVTELPADLGLRSFRKSGRVVLPASYALQAVESHPPGFDLSRALDSTLGELAPDSLALMIGPTVAAGDTLRLWFTSTADTSQRGEDCFFIASRPLTVADFAGHRPRDERPQAQPLVFALHQNLPNPFAATTTIGFALPVASPVRLEVYDLLGRRVRTLANAFYPAGEHEVVWNRRTASGALASPGLYFYRIAAGQYREKKRMVILP